MKHHCDPPRWAEHLLIRFLQTKDRDPVAGDLLEEYRENVFAGVRPVRADRRYMRRVFSILYAEFWKRTTVSHLLGATCVLSIGAMIWFGLVGSTPAAGPVAVVFIAQSLLTMAKISGRRRVPGLLLGFGAIALAVGGALALYETVMWTVFEICVALTGLALIFQGVLTLALQLGRLGGFPSRRPS